MNYVWSDALEVCAIKPFFKMVNRHIVVARYTDKVVAYDLKTQHKLFYFTGSFKQMEVSPSDYYVTIFVLDYNGIDRRVSPDVHGWGDITEELLMGDTYAELYDCTVDEIILATSNHHIYRVTRNSSGVTQEVCSTLNGPLIGYDSWAVSGDRILSTDARLIKTERALSMGEALASSYWWPRKVKRTEAVTPEFRYYRGYENTTHGSSFFTTCPGYDVGLTKFDYSDLTLNTTGVSTGQSPLAISNDICVITYSSDYKLFRYNNTTRKYEEDLAFNSARAALPITPKSLFIVESLNIAVAYSDTDLLIISLTDGVVTTHNISSSGYTTAAYEHIDLGPGKPKLFAYTTYPTEYLHLFNLETFTTASRKISDDLAKYEPEYNAYLAKQEYPDSIFLPIYCGRINAFKQGVAISPMVYTYAGRAFLLGTVRYAIDPVTYALTELDTDITALNNAYTQPGAYSPVGRYKAYVNYYYKPSYKAYCFNQPPPYGNSLVMTDSTTYRADYDGPIDDSSLFKVIADPTDVEKDYMISSGPASTTFVMYDFDYGKCLPIDSLEHSIITSKYIVAIILSDGERFLVGYSRSYNWRNSYESALGKSEGMGCYNPLYNEEVDNSHVFKPYFYRGIDEVSSLKYTCDGDTAESILITFLTGKTLVLTIGELLA